MCMNLQEAPKELIPTDISDFIEKIVQDEEETEEEVLMIWLSAFSWFFIFMVYSAYYSTLRYSALFCSTLLYYFNLLLYYYLNFNSDLKFIDPDSVFWSCARKNRRITEKVCLIFAIKIIWITIHAFIFHGIFNHKLSFSEWKVVSLTNLL